MKKKKWLSDLCDVTLQFVTTSEASVFLFSITVFDFVVSSAFMRAFPFISTCILVSAQAGVDIAFSNKTNCF